MERFEFTFDAEETFDFDASLIDGDGEGAEEENLSLENVFEKCRLVNALNLPTKATKRRGNLIRDTNKSVSVAVLKSGRLMPVKRLCMLPIGIHCLMR